jgi:hypothetical protein
LRDRAAVGTLIALIGAWSAFLLLRWDAPFIDLPQHAWNLAMLRDPGAWAPGFHVRLRWLDTNSLWFQLDRVLALALTPGQSLAVGFVLAIVGLPLASGYWARELGRDGLLAVVFASWVCWSGMIYWGFLHYCLGVALGVAMLGLDRRQQRDGAGAGWLAAGWVALYSLHLIALAWTLILVVVQRAVFHAVGEEPVRRDRLAAAILAVVPGGLLSAVWFWRNLIRPGGQGTLGTLEGGLGLRWSGWTTVARALVGGLGPSASWTWNDDAMVVILLAIGALGLAWALRTGRGRTPAWAAFAVVACSLLGMFTIPDEIRGQFLISRRLVAFIPAGAAVLAAPRVRARQRRLLLALGAAMALVQMSVQHRTVLRFAEEAAPAHRMMAQAPPGKTLASWLEPTSSSVVRGPVYVHMAAWYAARAPGEAAFSFAHFEPNPVVYAETSDDRVTSSEAYRQWCTAFRGAATDVDLVLVRGTRPGAHCGALRIYGNRLRELARDGDWALYEVARPLGPRQVDCRCRRDDPEPRPSSPR